VSDLEAVVARLVRAEVDRRLAELGVTGAPPAWPALVTVAAYAAARSISPATVRAAIREGRLEAHRIGRAVRVPAAAEIARPVRVRAGAATATAAAARALGLRVVR
jgi:excisionase family DNA binding protein